MNEMKTGLLPMPANRVGMFPTFAPSDDDLLSDADLKKAFESRPPARETFKPEDFILDQNPYNSCCPHAMTAGNERTHYRKTGDHVKLSPVASYALLNGGTDNGAVLADAMHLVMSKGQVLKSVGRPDQIYTQQYPKGFYDDGVRFRSNCFEARSERRVATALARGLVVAVAIQVENPFANFRGVGPDDVAPAAGGNGNHATLLHDARWNAAKGRLEYDMVNSWGLTWGWKGHCWTYWAGHYAQTNQAHVFYAFESSYDDPNDPTRPPVVAG